MRSKNTAMKLACILGGLAFLMAITAYAINVTLGDAPTPSGGAGPPIDVEFEWAWKVNNDSSGTITATANTDDAWLKKHVPLWPDSNTVSLTATPFFSPLIPSGWVWQSSRVETRSGVMGSGNKYYWKWDGWTVNASTGDSGSRTGGKGGRYNCL